MRCLFVDPGTLRHELSLQARAPDDPDGNAWIEIARLYARIEPIADRSRFAAGRPLETATHRVTLRWRPQVEAGMRLQKAGRIFTILTVTDPDERQRYLFCRTSEDKP